MYALAATRGTAGRFLAKYATSSTRSAVLTRDRSYVGAVQHALPTSHLLVQEPNGNNDSHSQYQRRQRQQQQQQQRRQFHALSRSTVVHPSPRSSTQTDNLDQKQHHNKLQVRTYHSTPSTDRAVAIILGLATLSAVSYAGASAVQSYRQWKASQPSEEELEKQRREEAKQRMQDEEQAKQQQQQQQQQQQKASGKSDGKRTNIFKEWFGVGVGSKFYEGGFEDTMTRREAALILGVRESTSAARIKEAHRKLLILNHPDTGGSTYIAGKINEAKELLLKNKAK